MSIRDDPFLALTLRLAVCSLALGSCAAPVSPNDFPTRPAATTPAPVPTAQPPAATAMLQSTQAVSRNRAVPATSVMLGPIYDLVFDTEGNLYLTQCGGAALLKVDLFGLLTTNSSDAGGFSGDGGPVGSAGFNCASGFTVDQGGNLYLVDAGNNRVRRIDPSGIVTTVAGNGPPGEPVSACNCQIPRSDQGAYAGDGGLATLARLDTPAGVAIDAAGNLYIADSFNNRIRKVDRHGIMTTFAGNGQAGFSGDGGLAVMAELQLAVEFAKPIHMTFDAQGNLYIADVFNGRIRKVDRDGIITTIAGTGGGGSSGDGGPATEAKISVSGLAFDAQGNLYVSDSARVRRIDTHGIITTVAGTGEAYLSGDGGLATAATLYEPGALAFDHDGSLYLVDHLQVRKIDKTGMITTVAGGHF